MATACEDATLRACDSATRAQGSSLGGCAMHGCCWSTLHWSSQARTPCPLARIEPPNASTPTTPDRRPTRIRRGLRWSHLTRAGSVLGHSVAHACRYAALATNCTEPLVAQQLVQAEWATLHALLDAIVRRG
jgi:hypothetical protein